MISKLTKIKDINKISFKPILKLDIKKSWIYYLETTSDIIPPKMAQDKNKQTI